MSSRYAVAALLFASSFAAPSAFALGDQVQANCASVSQGDVQNSSITVICGIAPELVAQMVGQAVSTNPADRVELLTTLRAARRMVLSVASTTVATRKPRRRRRGRFIREASRRWSDSPPGARRHGAGSFSPTPSLSGFLG